MIFLEGPDIIGKSTAFKLINPILPISDRHMAFTETIKPDGFDLEKIKRIVSRHNEDLFVILYTSNSDWFNSRLALRENPDEHDLQCIAYNKQYTIAKDCLAGFFNVRAIDVYGLDKFQKVGRIFEEYFRWKNY